MRVWKVILGLVAIGIVGAWVGYWLGFAAGWATDAEFPLHIGGGARAIGLSIALSFLSVMGGLWWFVARPVSRLRDLLSTGIPAHATILRVWRMGTWSIGVGRRQREYGFELEVHPDGARDYRVEAIGLLDELEEPALLPGAEVDVRYDPVDPMSVAVVGPVIGSA